MYMPSSLKIGPSGGPHIEFDEVDGELVLRIPGNMIDATGSAISNLETLNGVTVEAHSDRHESGGADQLDVTGLSGDLADAQDAKTHGNGAHNPDFATQGDFDNHSGRHESGGQDEINVSGLSGDLADAQDAKAHSGTHGYQGSDELATALRYAPQAEPETPTTGCVRWYDDLQDAYKVKFSDGSAITVGEL